MHAQHAGWAILTDIACSEAGSVDPGVAQSASAASDLRAQDGQGCAGPAIPLFRRRDGRPARCRTVWPRICSAPRRRTARPLFVGSNPSLSAMIFMEAIDKKQLISTTACADPPNVLKVGRAPDSVAGCCRGPQEGAVTHGLVGSRGANGAMEPVAIADWWSRRQGCRYTCRGSDTLADLIRYESRGVHSHHSISIMHSKYWTYTACQGYVISWNTT